MNASESNRFYVTGGTMGLDAPSYIVRDADEQLFKCVQSGEFCYVLTSRQVGKSSLMVRTAERLRREGWEVARVDLTDVGGSGDEQTDDAWYFSIADVIAYELSLDVNLEEWWNKHSRTTPVRRLVNFFRLVLEQHPQEHVVVFFDEIDNTIHLPFTDDFFACIRACYNRRSLDKLFRRLSFVLLGVATPADLIKDSTRTPFNIGGRHIVLEDFTFRQALPLIKGLALPRALAERILRRVFFWTNGHPYLTQRMLDELSSLHDLSEGEAIVDKAAYDLFIEPPVNRTDTNVAFVRDSLTSRTEALEEIKAIYRSVRLQEDHVLDDTLSWPKSLLKLSGLLKVGQNGELLVRNVVYERAFADWEVGDAEYELVPPIRREVIVQKSQDEPKRLSTAKVVLLGDSGVGKTGLGWRLAHGEFREHASTHGQQFYTIDALNMRRPDGTECEVVLWDLAGQPDYRLLHALFLDDVDLALIVFDPTNRLDPFHGVEFWVQQLSKGRRLSGVERKVGEIPPTILVGARADRGVPAVTEEELALFCQRQGITGGYVTTSALTGQGLDRLLARMKAQIDWGSKLVTVSTSAMKRIRDRVLDLKRDPRRKRVSLRLSDLRQDLEKANADLEFTDAEVRTGLRTLERYGYVQVLRASSGEERVLLFPELVQNLAVSLVLEARRDVRGVGTIDEARLLAGEYAFHEIMDLSQQDKHMLLDSVVLLLLEHHICFRETEPVTGRSYLIFPDLITFRSPKMTQETSIEEGVSYKVTGAVENVYASLVVLLGYTNVFTRTYQWQDHAQYEFADGSVCGFRHTPEREGESRFVLYFGVNVGEDVRTLFQGLFERFLSRDDLTVFRLDPVTCPNCGTVVEPEVVRRRSLEGKDFVFCVECGQRIKLPWLDEPIQLTPVMYGAVEKQLGAAQRRSGFEQAVYKLQTYVANRSLRHPECFVSYAWGEPEHERWVERNLAADLRKAGIKVILDRQHDAGPAASVQRFVSQIDRCDWIVVVGTPRMRKKLDGRDPTTGSVVAVEVDILTQRLRGTEEKRATILPILLAGDEQSSLSPLVRNRVYVDMRDEQKYFPEVFDLILQMYGITLRDPAVSDLRDSLRMVEPNTAKRGL